MGKTRNQQTVRENKQPEYKTTLWVRERGSTFFRLMNTITSTSTFRTCNDRNLHLPERQWEVAVDQMEGWRMNGGMHSARFKIVQTNIFDPDQPPKSQFFGPN